MFKNRIANPTVKSLIEWILAIGLAVMLFLVLRMFVFRIAHVSGGSMLPTLEDGDMLVLNRAAIVFGEPGVGDVVAFPYPGNPSEHYIKRVIAVSGDIVDLVDGAFYVNGVPLDDAFSYESIWFAGTVSFPITVEDEHVFVLGDNRNDSKDSRHVSVGNIHHDDIIGRVLTRVWPIGSWGG